MSLLSIRDLHFLDLKNVTFKKKLPELYELKNCIENFPPWHFNESVFDHTISVVGELKEIFKRKNKKLRDYLNENPFNHYSRRYLLYLMTINHDIAKPETLVCDAEGYTRCPGHEEQGAIKTRPILDRFDLLDEEKERIVAMIRLHGTFCVTQHEKNPDGDYDVLKGKYSNFYLDLLLFELADTLALHVADDGRKLQQEMIDFYERKIGEYFNSS